MCLFWNSSCLCLYITYRNHIDSPWHWLWLCLILVGDPSPVHCPPSLNVKLLCCLALGPSLEETFCRKSWRLVTASQPRGPSSELRTETMVLAIPHTESEMWIGGREGGSEGAERRSEGESVLRERGRRKRERRKQREEGKWGVCCNHKRGKKKLLLCCTFPLRIPELTRPIFVSLSVLAQPLHVPPPLTL